MVEKPSSHPWTAAPWLPWSLGLALFTIVASHLVAWFNSTSLAGMVRTQQELFVGLTEYQGMLSDLDESARAIMLAPERSELRRKKAEAVEALQHQLGVLAEKAPIRGPIPKALIGLATHFRKKLVPQADQVQKHAAAPGPFAMDRFRTEYAEVRLQHAERVGELLEETRKLAEQSVSSGQHRLLLSAGLLLLLWSGAMAWLVGQARLRPQALDSALAVHAPSTVEHAAHPSAGSHASSHVDHSVPSPAPEGQGGGDGDLAAALAPQDHAPPASPPVAASLSDPTAPPPRDPDPMPAPVPTSTVAPADSASRVSTVGEGVSPTVVVPLETSSPTASGEMSQSQIADLLQQPQASDPAPVSSPSPSPSVVTPLATASATAPAVAAPTPTPIATATPAPTPVAAAPSVLPPGPVDLASLMGEAVEEPAVSPSQVSQPSPDPAASVPQPVAPVPPVPDATVSAPASVDAAAVQPAAALPAPAVPPASPLPAPQPAVAAAAVVPAPLPDVQTLMKGASAMTTEQLSAMLFGVAPASSAPAPVKAAPAPAAAPAAPPRTITGAEMATLKPGDDAPPVVDLSF